ncbi:MAG: hypothetical protein IKH45_07550 [Neisseriaceae bacterium]|nr:hypothetical protein [Neisseriaceae bacterium]
MNILENLQALCASNLFPTLIGTLVGALIGACVSLTVAKRTILASFGSQEMQDYNAIKDLEQKIFDCEIDKEKEENEKIKKLYEDKLEILWLQYRNTFEALCGRYLSKVDKIDKENFRKMYKKYITDLIENDQKLENAEQKYNPLTSVFDATITVYKELKLNKPKMNCFCWYFCRRKF